MNQTRLGAKILQKYVLSLSKEAENGADSAGSAEAVQKQFRKCTNCPKAGPSLAQLWSGGR